MNVTKKYENLKELAGIYFIWCLITKKYYIGRTKCFKRRKREHFYLLQKNIHPNYNLQDVWNKYGKENFIFDIAYEMSSPTKARLIEAEQFWLNSLKPWDRNVGYNISKKAESGGKPPSTVEQKEKYSNDAIERCGKIFEIVSPSGILFKIKGLRKFCRDNNLCLPSIWGVLNRVKLYHKGWHLPENKIDLTKFENYKFISPEGKLLEVRQLELKEFCKNNNIDFKTYHGLIQVWNGYCQYNNGWSRFDNPQLRIFLSSFGEIVYMGIGRNRDFIEKYNLTNSGLRNLIHGNVKSHRGWKYLGLLRAEDVGKLEKF